MFERPSLAADTAILPTEAVWETHYITYLQGSPLNAVLRIQETIEM